MNKDFIKSLESFKLFMSSDQVPNYVKRYCKDFDEIQWRRFYIQLLDTVHLVRNVSDLFYFLKWILKDGYDNITYSLLLHSVQDPDYTPHTMFKGGWGAVLLERFEKRLKEDLKDIRESSNVVIPLILF